MSACGEDEQSFQSSEYIPRWVKKGNVQLYLKSVRIKDCMTITKSVRVTIGTIEEVEKLLN